MFAIGEVMNRSVDRELMEQAFQERRILLTEDKDFGWLVFVSRAESAGVILIRYPGKLRSTLAQAVLRLVKENAPALSGAFVVMEPNQIRISPRGATA